MGLQRPASSGLPTASLSANPTAITAGQSPTLTWSSTNATSCTGTGFSTGNATAGSVTVTPSITTSYSVSCTGSGGTATASATVGVFPSGPVAVTTYHYDTLRTGWNKQETTLTAASFPKTFGVLATVTLDEQVDAQPLIVPGLTINGGVHDVVYVVTEANTVYAIDASSGNILLQRHLGSPVPIPLGCVNNSGVVGITGTPVIDTSSQTLYLIAYINGSPPTYQLHALSLTDLTDRTNSSVTVTASHTLTNGSTFTFNATYQRQRPALLLYNGIVYAAFGSFCDFRADVSRGWLLGWTASTHGAIAVGDFSLDHTGS